MSCIFFVFLFIIFCSAEDIVKFSTDADNILCRACGTQILKSDNIITKISAASPYSFNDTLFNRKEVTVQVLIRDIFLQHPIITSSNSTCLGKGDWEDDDLWFPDYAIKPCFCPICEDLVGWVFKNNNPTIVNSTEKFFGIILASIIGENFTNSLVAYPDSLN